MGLLSTLFFDANNPEKQTLHRRITPTDDQYEAQEARWNTLADHVTTETKTASGCPVRTWLQGSYKFGTQIRPVRKGEEFDIDLGVYFEWPGLSDDGVHTPKALRSFTQQCLLTYAQANAEDVIEITSPPKTRCCRIRYKDDFHIDVPVYHLDDDKNLRALATDSDWEESDPKAIYIWFSGYLDDAVRAKARRHIRYLKAWAALRFKEGGGRPSSILLTVLVAEAVRQLKPGDLSSDDEAFATILVAIHNRLEQGDVVLNPVNHSENLCRLDISEFYAFRHALTALAKIVRRAVDADTVLEGAEILQEAFEHLFPMPDLSEVLKEDAVAHLPALRALPEVLVVATTDATPPQQFTGTNSIGPIPKDCSLKFSVTNPGTFPAGSQISWVVRNEGAEAENINDLGHLAGTGLHATERSSYKGTHYMDCIVKHAGRLVSMRRVPVRIMGITAPRRNPVQKTAWRLLGRR